MIDSQAEKLINNINQDMRQAMKDKGRIRLNELRSLLALISNAEAVVPAADNEIKTQSQISGAAEGVGSTDVPRKQLTYADIQSIITAEINEIKDTLASLDESNKYAAELREKLNVLQKYKV